MMQQPSGMGVQLASQELERPPEMIVVRIIRDIRSHFPARWSEWIMAGPLLGWALTMSGDPETFSRSPSFAQLARYGDESFWAWICLVAWTARVAALIVNGTLKERFPYSPHLRAGACLFAAILWGQITLGTYMAWWLAGGAATGVFAYGTFVIIELRNLLLAWGDVGTSQRRP